MPAAVSSRYLSGALPTLITLSQVVAKGRCIAGNLKQFALFRFRILDKRYIANGVC